MEAQQQHATQPQQLYEMGEGQQEEEKEGVYFPVKMQEQENEGEYEAVGEQQDEEQQRLYVEDEQQHFVVDGQWGVETMDHFITEDEEADDLHYATFGNATATAAEAAERHNYLLDFFPPEAQASSTVAADDAVTLSASSQPQEQQQQQLLELQEQQQHYYHQKQRHKREEDQQEQQPQAMAFRHSGLGVEEAELLPTAAGESGGAGGSLAAGKGSSRCAAAGGQQHAAAAIPEALLVAADAAGEAAATEAVQGRGGKEQHQGSELQQVVVRQRQLQRHSQAREEHQQLVSEGRQQCVEGNGDVGDSSFSEKQQEATGEASTPLLGGRVDVESTLVKGKYSCSTVASYSPHQQQQQQPSTRSWSPGSTGMTPLLSPCPSVTPSAASPPLVGLSLTSSPRNPAAAAPAAGSAGYRPPPAAAAAAGAFTSATGSSAAAANGTHRWGSSRWSPSAVAATVCGWLHLPVHLFKSPQELVRMLANRIYYSRVMAVAYAGVFLLNFYVLYRCLTLAQLDCFTLAAEVCVTLTLLFEVLLRALLSGWKFFSKYENLFDVAISLLCVALLFASDMRPSPTQGGKTAAAKASAAHLLPQQRAPPEDASDILRESLTSFRFATQLLRMISLGLHHSRAKLPATDDVDFSYLQERTRLHDDGL